MMILYKQESGWNVKRGEFERLLGLVEVCAQPAHLLEQLAGALGQRGAVAALRHQQCELETSFHAQANRVVHETVQQEGQQTGQDPRAGGRTVEHHSCQSP